MSERVVGALRAERATIGGGEMVLLFFTSTRVIVAKETFHDSLGTILFLGLGPVGVIVDMLRGKQKKRDEELVRARGYRSSPESILKMDKKNFALSYSDILKVEIKLHKRTRRIEIRVTTPLPDKMPSASDDGHIKPAGSFTRLLLGKTLTHSFSISVKKEEMAPMFDNIVSLVRSVLPGKLFIKR